MGIKNEAYWRKRNFYQDLRGALTGQTVGLPLAEIMVFWGKSETIKRLEYAIKRQKETNS